MSLPMPTLDDRSYADLLEEARALIPGLAPQWTNHNPSDPGITLIELFAWLTEMLIYRIDRLPEASTRAFLRLLNGREPGDLDEEIRATVLDLRRRDRAVTADDCELLAREASPRVARARCVAQRNLAERIEELRLVPREGWVSVVVVPDPGQDGALDPASWPGAPLPAPGLLSEVHSYLEPRRLITVRQVVVPPVYVPIQAEIVVATRPDVPFEPLRQRVANALTAFLDASAGGPDGEGWTFGRDVYVSDLYRLLEKEVPGVDYVPDITLSSTCPEGAPHCVAGGELWHEEGDPIGIELKAHHLPWARIDPACIVVGSAFVPVRIELEVVADERFASAEARRAVQTAVKRLFHPLHGGPGAGRPWEITGHDIAGVVTSLPQVRRVANLVLTVGPTPSGEAASTTDLRFEGGEIADVTVTVDLMRRTRS